MERILRTAGGFSAGFLVYLVAGTLVGSIGLVASGLRPTPDSSLLVVLVMIPTIATIGLVSIVADLGGGLDWSTSGATNLAVVNPMAMWLLVVLVLAFGIAGFFAWRTRSTTIAWVLVTIYLLECLAIVATVVIPDAGAIPVGR